MTRYWTMHNKPGSHEDRRRIAHTRLDCYAVDPDRARPRTQDEVDAMGLTLCRICTGQLKKSQAAARHRRRQARVQMPRLHRHRGELL